MSPWVAMLWEEIDYIPLLATATVSRLQQQFSTSDPHKKALFCPHFLSLCIGRGVSSINTAYGLSSPEYIKEFVACWYGNIYLYICMHMYINIHIHKYCIFKRSYIYSVKLWPSCVMLGFFLLCGLHNPWHKDVPSKELGLGKVCLPSD